MRSPLLLALGLALGCASSKDDSGSTGGNADGAADGADGDELNGDTPDSDVPAPTFTAANRDGSARSREDLLGQPSVMWFYPLAASAG